MQCRVDGCERDARYKAAQLCQKHYFRVRRSGGTDLKPVTATPRVITPNGYVRVYRPGHPLAISNYVFEQRMVMWEEVGLNCAPCEICGRDETWKTCHVDHRDEDRQNNDRSNLRILCRGCNVKRGFRPQSYESRSQVGLIEFEGKVDTATGWARDPRVKVTGATILRRKASGMSDFDALFAPKVTHKGDGQ